MWTGRQIAGVLRTSVLEPGLTSELGAGRAARDGRRPSERAAGQLDSRIGWTWNIDETKQDRPPDERRSRPGSRFIA